MPLVATLRLDDAAAMPVAAMWRASAEGCIDDDCLRLGYPPHVTMAVWPDRTPIKPLIRVVERLSGEWDALPLSLAGFGLFPGAPAVLWLAPVVTSMLLARQAALVAAVPNADRHEPYRPEHWIAHVTLGQAGAPACALQALTPLWRGAVTGRLDRTDLVRFQPAEVARRLPLGG